jgi:hypothetical protein
LSRLPPFLHFNRKNNRIINSPREWAAWHNACDTRLKTRLSTASFLKPDKNDTPGSHNPTSHSTKKRKIRSMIMGDKGGKKDKRKNQKQSSEKQDQKQKSKAKKQQKEKPTLLLPA